MNRTIYLIRHGQPDFPDGSRVCLSRKDLPLDTLGRMQGVLLKRYFENKNLTVYHSGMMRTRETAAYISEDCRTDTAFLELDVGAWEGRTFSEIRRDFPELYVARGIDPYHCRIPGGEWPEDCLLRAKAGLDRIACSAEKDVAIVAHAGVNRLLLCGMSGMPMEAFLHIAQPYGCVNTLVEENGQYAVTCVGEQPHPELDESICEELLEAYGTPEHVRRHCRAVARKAIRLADGLDVNMERLHAAALLHDIARTEENHAKIGAEMIRALGYPKIAAAMESHHHLSEEEERKIDEKALLFLADKLVMDDREVTLEERFAKSSIKAKTAEAKAAHAGRLAQAHRLYKRIVDERAGGIQR